MNMKIDIALELLIALIAQSQSISLLIQKARSENRETLTEEEWKGITTAADAARARLAAALDA